MKPWHTNLLITLAGVAANYLIPVVADGLRGWRKSRTEKAARTPEPEDDEFWETVGPMVDRLTEIADPSRGRVLTNEESDERAEISRKLGTLLVDHRKKRARKGGAK